MLARTSSSSLGYVPPPHTVILAGSRSVHWRSTGTNSHVPEPGCPDTPLPSMEEVYATAVTRRVTRTSTQLRQTAGTDFRAFRHPTEYRQHAPSRLPAPDPRCNPRDSHHPSRPAAGLSLLCRMSADGGHHSALGVHSVNAPAEGTMSRVPAACVALSCLVSNVLYQIQSALSRVRTTSSRRLRQVPLFGGTLLPHREYHSRIIPAQIGCFGVS